MTTDRSNSVYEAGTRGRNQRISVSDVGPISQSRNRIRTALNETYAEATNTITWSANDDITEVVVLVTATAGEVSQSFLQGHIDVVINAANEIVATALLTEADSQNSDSQIERFLINERFVIRSKTPITRLDFNPVDVGANMTNIKAWVGAH